MQLMTEFKTETYLNHYNSKGVKQTRTVYITLTHGHKSGVLKFSGPPTKATFSRHHEYDPKATVYLRNYTVLCFVLN